MPKNLKSFIPKLADEDIDNEERDQIMPLDANGELILPKKYERP